tara:strand:+ start:769 stop:1254 length:486 start_codon:yes stop_codon:yes gene_type:complete
MGEPANNQQGGVELSGLGASLKRRGLVPDAVFQRALARLSDCLDAKKMVRGNGTTGAGTRTYDEMLDYPVVLSAVKLTLELETGRAPQTLDINTNTGGGKRAQTFDDAMLKLQADPVLAERIFGNMLKVVREAAKSSITEVSTVSHDSKAEIQSALPHSTT